MNHNAPLPTLAKTSSRCITLAAHTANVCRQADDIIKARPFVCRKYYERLGLRLEDLLRQSAQWHDAGKRHQRWQAACQKDYQAARHKYQQTGVHTSVGRYILKTGVRHELASLEFMRRYAEQAKIQFPFHVRTAIAAHHGKLSKREKFEKHWVNESDPGFQDFWNEFVRASTRFRTGVETDFELAVNERYAQAGVRSLLQLADHRASASEDEEPLPPLQSFAYKFPHAVKRGVQREIEKLWDESFAILRAPTGAGKTDAALLWARHQIVEQRADRLVIAMPTRFTANALAINAANALSATGLYHSSALYQQTKSLYAATNDNENTSDEAKDEIQQPKIACLIDSLNSSQRFQLERFIDKEQELARRLETPVTVTTIDHLCISLTGTREDHHATFFNLAHSCLVIDEADFYDDFTQQNIVTLLRALKQLNVPVLLMSATVPESARTLYAASGMNAAKIQEDSSDLERQRANITRHPAPFVEAVDLLPLLERSLSGEPTIIYVNTVRRAQQLYLYLIEQIETGAADISVDDVVLYHSRFTEPDKAAKEEKLLRQLGREAWKRGARRGIAILTQIGEISVNISADYMVSELCPLDRLAQRAGRLARFDERADGKRNVIGELIIVEPHRLNKHGQIEFYPAPYGRYDDDTHGWQMSETLQRSNELLVDGAYSARDFIILTDKLYPTVKTVSSHVRDNQRQFENCAILNWLILPQEQVDNEADDERTKDWRSRNIPLQHTVYANVRASNFDFDEADELPTTWRERRRFDLRHGVKCHAHEYAAAHRSDLLLGRTFAVRERDIETLWLVKQHCYNSDIGLYFHEASTDE